MSLSESYFNFLEFLFFKFSVKRKKVAFATNYDT